MKIIGIVILISGIVGLVLDLIFWLPFQFSPVVTALIAVACLVVVWGGGALYQSKAAFITQTAVNYEPVSLSQSTQWSQPATGTICPRCGCQVMPGQQYCGGCGSSLVSYCARCGATIKEPSKFCGSCGAQLN